MKEEEIKNVINEARKQGFYDTLFILYGIFCMGLLMYTFSFEARTYDWIGADAYLLFTGIIFYMVSPIIIIVKRLL